jgi:hypothetical protein
MNEPPQPVVLYMHIPKAAGTTVSDVLFHCLKRQQAPRSEEKGHLMHGVYYYPSGFIAPVGEKGRQELERVLARRDLSAILGHCHFGLHEALAVPSTYVTILRPPLERFVSLYYFHRLVQSRWGKLEGVMLPDDMDLEAFAHAAPYRELDNGQTRRISGDNPEIGGCTPEMIERAKSNLREFFTAVGTTGQLEETLVLMQRKFRWRSELAYYPKNVNPDRPPAEDLPDSVRAAILARNALDVELYDYASGLLAEAIREGDARFREDVDKLKCRNREIAQTRAR